MMKDHQGGTMPNDKNRNELANRTTFMELANRGLLNRTSVRDNILNNLRAEVGQPVHVGVDMGIAPSYSVQTLVHHLEEAGHQNVTVTQNAKGDGVDIEVTVEGSLVNWMAGKTENLYKFIPFSEVSLNEQLRFFQDKIVAGLGVPKELFVSHTSDDWLATGKRIHEEEQRKLAAEEDATLAANLPKMEHAGNLHRSPIPQLRQKTGDHLTMKELLSGPPAKYSMGCTTTGRMSASEPNMPNTPGVPLSEVGKTAAERRNMNERWAAERGECYAALKEWRADCQHIKIEPLPTETHKMGDTIDCAWQMPEGYRVGDYANKPRLHPHELRNLTAGSIVASLEAGVLYAVDDTQAYVLFHKTEPGARTQLSKYGFNIVTLAHTAGRTPVVLVGGEIDYEKMHRDPRSAVNDRPVPMSGLVDISNPDPGSYKPVGLGIPMHSGWSSYDHG